MRCATKSTFKERLKDDTLTAVFKGCFEASLIWQVRRCSLRDVQQKSYSAMCNNRGGLRCATKYLTAMCNKEASMRCATEYLTAICNKPSSLRRATSEIIPDLFRVLHC